MLDKNIAIEFNNVGKQYRLGLVGTGTLSHDLNRWWQTTILGKDDPYLKIGEVNDRSSKGNSDYVWALKDISFKVEQGDVVGIIGKNGAGKSTLLKLLSHITAPSTGTIDYRGRIASLLEVGTGFHPEMTARQNIYMNGSIMGMTRHEIDRKLDEIVDFAGIERYLDTPVKRFSSGMTVRLGFAVAAFLEPEILVVDEVLAVGDAEFQKKAIGKMKDVSRGEGRTVLFVSHNMNAVKRLCTSGVVLNNGMIDYIGSVADCVQRYMGRGEDCVVSHVIINEEYRTDHGSFWRDLLFQEAWITNLHPEAMACDEPLCLKVRLRKQTCDIDRFQFSVIIKNCEDIRVAFYLSDYIQLQDCKEDLIYNIRIPRIDLAKGFYSVTLEVNQLDFHAGCRNIDHVNDVMSFRVLYVHQHLQDEFLHWKPSWGLRLHNASGIEVENESFYLK